MHQPVAVQLDALRAAGCAQIFEDVGSTDAPAPLPGLRQAVDSCTRGSELVVMHIDRISRVKSDLLDVLVELSRRGAGFRSLAENRIVKPSEMAALIAAVKSAP